MILSNKFQLRKHSDKIARLALALYYCRDLAGGCPTADQLPPLMKGILVGSRNPKPQTLVGSKNPKPQTLVGSKNPKP